MARPITGTPMVTGKDAEELLASIEKVASPEEIKRRTKAAREFIEMVTRRKPGTVEDHDDDDDEGID